MEIQYCWKLQKDKVNSTHYFKFDQKSKTELKPMCISMQESELSDIDKFNYYK